MADGPGKYDMLCTMARVMANAEGAILLVINGERGTGFSVQGPLELHEKIPELLEELAKKIRLELETQRKGAH